MSGPYIGVFLLALLTACADPGAPPATAPPAAPADGAPTPSTPVPQPSDTAWIPPAATTPPAADPAGPSAAPPSVPIAPSTDVPPAPPATAPAAPPPDTGAASPAAPSTTPAATAAAAIPCLPMPLAPGSFPNPRATPGLAGVVAPGFLGLQDDKGVLQLAHGVDLSDHNSPDYDKIKGCGADFAVIKLYPTNPKLNMAQIQALTQRQIAVIPYYFLSMPAAYKYFPEKFSSDEALEAIITDTTATGQADAQAFLAAYARLFNAPAGVNMAGLNGPVIALDVEEAFQTTTAAALKARAGFPALKESAISADELDRYGQAYSAMVVSWVKTVQAARPDAIILFYTYPQMYITYLTAARPADFAVINGMPVWLAEYTAHGGDIDDASAATRQGAALLCGSASAGNKCVVHQYTGRGAFGSTVANAFTDLDRFFTVDQVPDASGVQYVRKLVYVGQPPAAATPTAPAPATPTP